MNDALHLVCPHCDAINRLPQERLAEGPTCGRCKAPLFPGQPRDVDAAGFERRLGRDDLPLVVDFWAPWCGPCRAMAPAFKAAAAQLEPRARLLKVNTEEEQALAARHGIRSIPTLAVFHRGREIARQAGAMDTGAIVRWVRSVL